MIFSSDFPIFLFFSFFLFFFLLILYAIFGFTFFGTFPAHKIPVFHLHNLQ